LCGRLFGIILFLTKTFFTFEQVINFTVSRSSSKATWGSWLDDWKLNAGAQVQITDKGEEEGEDEEEEDDETTQQPPRENLPIYPIKRFR